MSRPNSGELHPHGFRITGLVPTTFTPMHDDRILVQAVVNARPLLEPEPGEFDAPQRELTRIGFLEWMH